MSVTLDIFERNQVEFTSIENTYRSMMPPSDNISLCLILLAAGESRRFGSAKQLAVYNGETLLDRALHIADDVCERTNEKVTIVVVLGAHADEILDSLKHHPQSSTALRVIVVNHLWARGIASSIRRGVEEAQRLRAQAVLMMSCDQILVDSDHLMKLIKTYTDVGATIVATGYEETMGIPVLFNAAYFDELARLEGDAGAKGLLKKYADNVHTVVFDNARVDIDTKEQLEQARRSIESGRDSKTEE